MKSTLIDLFTSKKFLAAVTAVVVYVAGRFGFDLDTATLDRVFAALLVYVGAQGVADVGKSAAVINAAAAATPTEVPIVPGSPADLADQMRRGVAKFVPPMLVLIVIGSLAVTLAAGCSTAKAIPGAVKAAVVQCVKLNQTDVRAAAIAAAGETVAELIDTHTVDPGKLLAIAERPGIEVGGCALIDFLDELARRRAAPVATDLTATARVGAPPEIAAVQAVLERLRAKGGGVQWQTADGVVR